MQSGKILCTILFFGLLIAAAWKDAVQKTIPNHMVIALGLTGLVSSVFYPEITLWERAAGALCVSLPMMLAAWLVPGAFGGGDIKLTAAAGLFMGWRILAAVGVAVICGGLYGLLKILVHKANRKTAIALGPFFCLGIAAVFFDFIR